MAEDASYGPKTYRQQGGDVFVVGSGGEIKVADGGDVELESGGEINVQSGGEVNILSGGDVEVESGGDINVQSGGNIKLLSGGILDVLTGGIVKANGTQEPALTTQLTSITHTSPGTPDYAIQQMTASSPVGFATVDEADTVLSVILNLQVRLAEIEASLEALGLVIAN